MIRLKMHSMYDHFPNNVPVEGEPYIDCYNDNFVQECKGEGKNIALLLEPRSMIGSAYEYVYEHQNYFKYIFTHDSKLLTLPQSRIFNWSDIWLETDSDKTKGISLCTSHKDWCPLHHARLELANYYIDKPEVDVFFGEWVTPEKPSVKPDDYLEHYKFSIIIENDLDEYWFTEKILNCFSTKTIPIYVGATKIYELFDADGIIQVNDYHDIPRIIDHLNIDEAYANRKNAIEHNYKAIEPYKIHWKHRFLNYYGLLLEELQNG